LHTGTLSSTNFNLCPTLPISFSIYVFFYILYFLFLQDYRLYVQSYILLPILDVLHNFLHTHYIMSRLLRTILLTSTKYPTDFHQLSCTSYIVSYLVFPSHLYVFNSKLHVLNPFLHVLLTILFALANCPAHPTIYYKN